MGHLSQINRSVMDLQFDQYPLQIDPVIVLVIDVSRLLNKHEMHLSIDPLQKIPFEGYQRHSIPLDGPLVVIRRPPIRLAEPLIQLIHLEGLQIPVLNDSILWKEPFGLVPAVTTPYSTVMNLLSISIGPIALFLIVLVWSDTKVNLKMLASLAEVVDVEEEEEEEETHDDFLPTLVWQMTMADLNALSFHHIVPLTNLLLHVHEHRLRIVT